MTSTAALRLAEIHHDYGGLSEDAHGHAGALAFVLRLLGEVETERDTARTERNGWGDTCQMLEATREEDIATAWRQAIEECAQVAERTIDNGDYDEVHIAADIRALANPKKEPTT